MADIHNREKILGTILALYSRLGIKSVTMDDISRQLGVSKKTLYQLVTDKVDLVNRVIDFDSVLNRQLAEDLLGSEINAIEELIILNERIHHSRRNYSATFCYDLKKYYPDIYRRWMDEKRTRIMDAIKRNIEKGKREGLYRDDLDPHIISKLYMARMEMLEDTDVLDHEEFLSIEFTREIFIYHLHGICSSRGLEYIEKQKHRI